MKSSFSINIYEEEFDEISTRLDYLAALRVLTENNLGSECPSYPDCSADSSFFALVDMLGLFAIIVEEHPYYSCPSVTVRVPPGPGKEDKVRELLIRAQLDIIDILDCPNHKCSDHCLTFSLEYWAGCLQPLAEFYVAYRDLWEEGDGDRGNADHPREWLRECSYPN